MYQYDRQLYLGGRYEDGLHARFKPSKQIIAVRSEKWGGVKETDAGRMVLEMDYVTVIGALYHYYRQVRGETGPSTDSYRNDVTA